ncbi:MULTISPECIES: hypothetical protein [Pediococcus]|uniref:DUF5067 domain-containing protein n=1 Tax=Pediococcus parvulus TaxID=54062 RepID=A0A176THD2_9LACO|nr:MULTISPECIES: hypothetical protein [Pediococcus]MCT3027405.1 hypothetical protein [Pediococcus parvulus]MCT3028907.1 hypothetical protein [Pediococcus parvulus]MCT3034939.1 hypothetical protein [Pediococcus parvulus]MDN5575223.1 hypothetical protein [Pediococcus sp.]MDV7694987.1 hypothetical protein [Pediococcus parvulus]
MKRKTLVISVAVVVCALIVGFLAIDFSGSTDGAKKFLNKYPIATVAKDQGTDDQYDITFKKPIKVPKTKNRSAMIFNLTYIEDDKGSRVPRFYESG